MGNKEEEQRLIRLMRNIHLHHKSLEALNVIRMNNICILEVLELHHKKIIHRLVPPRQEKESIYSLKSNANLRLRG